MPVTFVVSHRLIAMEARVGVTFTPMSGISNAFRAVRHPVAKIRVLRFVKDIYNTQVAVVFIVYQIAFVVSHLLFAVNTGDGISAFIRSVISIASVTAVVSPVAGRFRVAVTYQATITVKALAETTLKVFGAASVTVFASKFVQLVAASVTSLDVL